MPSTLRRLGFGIVLAAFTAANAAHAVEPLAPLPYNEQADARADIRQVVEQAKSAHKKVLLVFGANWCPDCRSLAAQLKEGELADKAHARYEIAKINIGRWDRNIDLAAEYGSPQKKGIPAVAVLDDDGKLIKATRADDLDNARTEGYDAILRLIE